MTAAWRRLLLWAPLLLVGLAGPASAFGVSVPLYTAPLPPPPGGPGLDPFVVISAMDPSATYTAIWDVRPINGAPDAGIESSGSMTAAQIALNGGLLTGSNVSGATLFGLGYSARGDTGQVFVSVFESTSGSVISPPATSLTIGPEPSTFVLLALGLAGGAAAQRRRKRAEAGDAEDAPPV